MIIPKTNLYDELSDVEESILKLGEEGVPNAEIASRLNMTYNQVMNLKTQMRRRGIFIVNPARIATTLTQEIKDKIIAMDDEKMTNRQMALALEVPIPRIAYWKQCMKAEGISLSTRMRGRPSKS